MPGLFSKIASAVTGGDRMLVKQIEEFSIAYVSQCELPRQLGLRREETAFLTALLAETLYRSYLTAKNREASDESLTHLAESKAARFSRLGLKPEAQPKLEEAFGLAAETLADVARQKGKFDSNFASVDGLTESLVADVMGGKIVQIRAAVKHLN